MTAYLTTASEASGRYHTNWLNMLYPRLKLARHLLCDDGVMMVSIDDGEIDHLKTLMSEIFGHENFLAILIWNKQHSQQQGVFKRYHEYIVCYARNIEVIKNIAGGEGEIEAGALKKVSRANPASEFTFPAGVRFDAIDGVELTGVFGDSEQVEVVKGRLRCKDGKTAEAVTLKAGWTQKNQMESWFAGKETYDTKEQKVLEFYFNSAGKLKCRKQRTKITPPSILPEYGMVSAQTGYLSELMGAPVFQTPKPVRMMEDFIAWFSQPGDLVLDFFAGSGTMGEAAYRVAATGLDVRFMLVQLPEPLNPSLPDQAVAANYCDAIGRPRNIAELTKERLRRAGDKVRSESEGGTSDTGFRVFKLDESNFSVWPSRAEDLQATLFAHQDHLVAGRSDDDLLYELLLKLGLDLCVPIGQRRIAGKDVREVGGGVLMACLAAEIAAGDVEEIAAGVVAWHRELAPVGDTTCVFRDSAFADDVAKTNIAAILEQNGIANVRSL